MLSNWHSGNALTSHHCEQGPIQLDRHVITKLVSSGCSVLTRNDHGNIGANDNDLYNLFHNYRNINKSFNFLNILLWSTKEGGL